ncbi:amino acid adenylation domain-containing protein [Streptomyces sp. Go40/10]|uniref:amino acid adenylation domain-containing protein n=1 Tax=Streptomyces sp. Go40/10 TaxID=2825844 RepID=UPI001E4EB7F5|nr:amino acid adenylation domain-containing protein [Streptomyces sp. Go40/10]UFR00362.1 amino acid adenylation domain-containing protein [Streptomyces sp. Go40/10]
MPDRPYVEWESDAFDTAAFRRARGVIVPRRRVLGGPPGTDGAARPWDVLLTPLPGGRTRLCPAVDPAVAGRRNLAHVTLPDPVPPTAGGDGAGRGADPDRSRVRCTGDPAPPPALPAAPARNPAAPPTWCRAYRSTAPGVWEGLAEAARSYGVTAGDAVVAAFAEVLRTWSTTHRFGFTHVCVGTRGIRSAQWERDADGATFAERARRSRASAPDPSSPVVLTTALHRAPPAGSGPPSVELSPRPQGLLGVDVTRDERGAVAAVWQWPADRCPPGTTEAMADAFRLLLERLGGNGPDWTSEHLRLVPEEQLALRARVNATQTPLPGGLLHTPVIEQARLRPHAPAVITAHRTLDYGELHRRMNQVGRRLRELGARPGRLVAVVMDKGWEQVVALHGVLASGAAYVPVDPAVPAERLRRLLDRARAGLVLTESRTDARVTWPDGVRRLCVDTDFDAVDDGPLEPVQRQTDLAYVIFTSGSTGTPKGVMVDHRGALNALHDVNRRVGMGPGDRCLALSGIWFDLSVYDTFGVTAAGGAVVVPDPSPYPDPGHWARLMDAAGVTFVLAVAALLEMLAAHLESGGERQRIARLRTVIQAGDMLPVALPGRLRALNPRVRVFNAGGPAESCVLSVIHAVGPAGSAATGIPLGRPMANQRYHVLDERLQPCPVWVPGEIHIASEVGLAQGYWRDGERTAACFRPVPGLGERVYASGDIARYLPDGELEILGRKDFQVKIQGVRIELGEIEAALAEHPAVASAVVVADRTVPDLPMLRAFAVAAGEARPELRAFLARTLPSAMVPADVTWLERLPLNANGKVDRLALARPDR